MNHQEWFKINNKLLKYFKVSRNENENNLTQFWRKINLIIIRNTMWQNWWCLEFK